MVSRQDFLLLVDQIAQNHHFSRKGERFIKQNKHGLFNQELAFIGGKGQHFKLHPTYDLVVANGRKRHRALAYLADLRSELSIAVGRDVGYYNNLFTDTSEWMSQYDALLKEVNSTFNRLTEDRAELLRYFANQKAFTNQRDFVLAIADS